MTASRRIAVTGAGGFIGTAVCREFVRRGDIVSAVIGPPGDALAAPPGVVRAERIAITDRAALRGFLAAGVDAVVHLAGPPSVRASFDDAPAFAIAHTAGTAALLDVCRELRIATFVYVSSAEVYGRPRTDPVDETHPLEARSPYGAAKIGAEQMVRAFDHAGGAASVILRPFSVYGAGMGPHALLPAILRQLDASGPLRLADLRPERDYCHVDDVARAVVAAAGIAPERTTAINVGSGVGISVRDVALTALALSGSDRGVEAVDAERRPGNSDILRLVADRTRAAAVLGWEPRISLADGLRAMLAAHAGAR